MFGLGKSKGKVEINGVTYEGSNLVIQNSRVYVDGVLQGEEPLSGVVEVRVVGDLQDFSCDANTVINGNVNGHVDVNGTLECGNVEGSIDVNGTCVIRKSS